VLSFVVLGLFLLAGAYAHQRMRAQRAEADLTVGGPPWRPA
jgi:hypothetical protein